MQVVAAFTDGDSDNLMVGRNGIFYDRKGRDWDATISKIVDNPISIRQAFWAPYKKVIRAVEEQIAKRAAAADAAATAQVQTAATTAITPVVTPAPAAPGTTPAKIDTGTLAAIGLVLTTLLTALGGIFAAIAGLPGWQIPFAIIGILLSVSLPSMFLAFMKLRKRNLGPILDANNWAVNARAKMNVPFGASLTAVAALPPGAHHDAFDPFAEKKSKWPYLLGFLVLVAIAAYLCFRFGYVNEWTHGRFGPAKKKPVASEKQKAEQVIVISNVPPPAAK
jgi:hypothetical protein